jgi:hypothetical protein
MSAEPTAADLHLPWLEFDMPAGSRLEELRVWQHENWHHAVGEVAAAALVVLPDASEAFAIRHVRHGHEDSSAPYGGVGRDDYLGELETIWVAFNHDATLTTGDLDEAVAALTSLAANGAIDVASA